MDGSGKDTALRQSVTNKSGTVTTYTYDAVNRLKTANLSNTSGTDYSYSYDPNSNLISKTVLGNSTDFTYNEPNQLTQAGSTTFVYDGAGNLKSSSAGFAASYNAKNQTTSMTPPGGEAVPMTYQDASQTKRVSASETDFDYTVLGLSSQTDRGLPDRNTFANPDNLKQLALETAEELATELTERSDVLGELTGGGEGTSPSTESATSSLDTGGSGSQTDGSLTDSGTSSSTLDPPPDTSNGIPASTTHFTRDNLGTLVSERTPEGTYYYLFDGLGSVVSVTDASGARVANYQYDPYGKQTSAEPALKNPWRFASGYTDPPTRFVKFGTRYYDPNVMRWTQTDPVKGTLKNPVTLNQYLYVGCNPINNTDATGTSSSDQCFFWGGVASGVGGTLIAALTGNPRLGFAAGLYGQGATSSLCGRGQQSSGNEQCYFWGGVASGAIGAVVGVRHPFVGLGLALFGSGVTHGLCG